MWTWRYNDRANIFGRVMDKATKDRAWSLFAKSAYVREVMYGMSARCNIWRQWPKGDGVVISDRSVVTGFVAHAEQLPEWYITCAEPRRYPGLVIYLSIDAEEAMRRIGERAKGEKVGVERLAAMRRAYENVLNLRRPRVLGKSKVVSIDGCAPVERVTKEAAEVIDRWLEGSAT